MALWRGARRFRRAGRSARVRARAWCVLLERLSPATSLVSIAEHDDDKATRILAHVIARLTTSQRIDGMATVREWGAAFDRYLAGGDDTISKEVVIRARDDYETLCQSQSQTRLLHGDLHHENVVYDDSRGWVAIDPKGVTGEIEYQLGAGLRNPHHFAQSYLEERMPPPSRHLRGRARPRSRADFRLGVQSGRAFGHLGH